MPAAFDFHDYPNHVNRTVTIPYRDKTRNVYVRPLSWSAALIAAHLNFSQSNYGQSPKLILKECLNVV